MACASSELLRACFTRRRYNLRVSFDVSLKSFVKSKIINHGTRSKRWVWVKIFCQTNVNEVDRRGWFGKWSTFVRNWTLKRLLLTQMVWWLNRSSSISQSTASSYLNATSKSTFFATNPVTVSVCKLFPLTEQPISTLGQTLGWCLIKNWDSNTSRPIKKVDFFPPNISW